MSKGGIEIVRIQDFACYYEKRCSGNLNDMYSEGFVLSLCPSCGGVAPGFHTVGDGGFTLGMNLSFF
jgi:hypothetical protein